MTRRSGGPTTVTSRAARTHRGSYKRLRRIRMRGNWSTELLVAALTIALSLLILIPLLLDNS